jgi:hypothetical protein
MLPGYGVGAAGVSSCCSLVIQSKVGKNWSHFGRVENVQYEAATAAYFQTGVASARQALCSAAPQARSPAPAPQADAASAAYEHVALARPVLSSMAGGRFIRPQAGKVRNFGCCRMPRAPGSVRGGGDREFSTKCSPLGAPRIRLGLLGGLVQVVPRHVSLTVH